MKHEEDNSPQLIVPDWPAPTSVQSLVTTRKAGDSISPFDGFNLALHVGDDALQVKANRQWLQDTFGLRQIQWLDQVHGTKIFEASQSRVVPEADGVFSSEILTGCAIMTADCLPVLMCSKEGGWVGAAHAGWRGLAAGVLPKLVASYPGESQELMAWLGPAIGPHYFEVGPEVKLAFCHLGSAADEAFQPSDRKGYWLANLYLLAELQFKQLGISAVYAGGFCTYSDQQQFYSYRRSQQTGRMASLIWLSA